MRTKAPLARRGQGIREFAPAKINLHLHVVGRRDDGYHQLDSLVVFAEVGDWLSVSPDNDLSLTVVGPFAGGLAAEPDNLVLRAARGLADRAGIHPTGALVLEKNLPVASGIGGGSADAAAALRLLSRFWGVVADLDGLAGPLGADVAVCLLNRAARMAGIGEVLSPAPRLPPVGLVLVNPGVAISTPMVFRARSGAFSQLAAFPSDGWRDADQLAQSLAMTRNDLEPPARSLSPVIADTVTALAETPGCLLARMSGSGATCFGLFASADVARHAAHAIRRDGWWTWGGGMQSG